MTVKLYLEDSYLKEATAKVVSTEGGIILDKTVFYPTGGGQPCDLGTISTPAASYTVTDVKKNGDDVLHIISGECKLAPGDEVRCAIDWERRYAHMRHHTALHVIDGVMEKKYNGAITGNQIYTNRLRMDIEINGLTREMVAEIIKDSQVIVDEGHDIIMKTISQAEALANPNLVRTEPGRELVKRLNSVQVLDIVGFDMQIDAGTHVHNTKEVGRIELSGFESKGANKKRVEVVLK
ncbi:MAG TPA: alanyl-tRNA editing protein [Candidatus Baltobacteraceae bacterium]|nr:alanyl-tRNA editing protein [Candidatus Baltobacteraceae bacterium]